MRVQSEGGEQASVPGRAVSNSARFVYGPIATTVAPWAMLAASRSRAAPGGLRSGATGSGQ